MGDSFVMLADSDVSLEDADALSTAVVASLQQRGMIATTPHDNELGEEEMVAGVGYPPGPNMQEFYDATKTDHSFFGGLVEPRVERHFNYWAYGPSFCGITCPKCSREFRDDLTPFGESFSNAFSEWIEGSESALLACPACSSKTPLVDWPATNPFGFCNFSLTFWNWPLFDQPEWLVDIPTLLQEITGHNIVSSFGKI